jgi:hypothetical protein
VPLYPPAYYAPPYSYYYAPDYDYAPGYAAPQQYWYFCPSANGYYPYVKECPGGWQQVMPQPPVH